MMMVVTKTWVEAKAVKGQEPLKETTVPMKRLQTAG